MYKIFVDYQREQMPGPRTYQTYRLDSLDQIQPDIYDIRTVTHIQGFVGAYVYDDAGNRVGIIHRQRGFVAEKE